jgi:hypothetical protein
MRGFFRRDGKPAKEHAISREEIASLLPASARHPEVNRFTPLGSDFDGEEGSDEDIEFLESIVREVDLSGTPPRRLATAPVTAPKAVTQDEAMSFFVELQTEREERQQLPIHVEEVEMFDLLEDLSTTAAALRRRKAA